MHQFFLEISSSRLSLTILNFSFYIQNVPLKTSVERARTAIHSPTFQKRPGKLIYFPKNLPFY